MKRFVLKSLLYSLPILIPIIIFVFFISPYLSGDIGPLGYIRFSKGYGELELLEDSKVIHSGYKLPSFSDSCLLTIGDSFSQGVSYNHFFAELTDYKVINMNKQCYTISPFVRFLYAARTNALPKTVIIETAERYFVDRLCEMNIDQFDDLMFYKYKIDTNTTVIKQSSRKTVLEKSQEWMKRKIGYDENPIKFCELNKPCFTCSANESSLYFYDYDIINIPTSDSLLNISILKLDSLFAYADSIGIDLYLLIAADKYDVYQTYIIENPYPKQDVLERLYLMYPHPRVINSKDTLSKMVASDVMDVYWCNDTHWSPVGARAVAHQVLEVITSNKLKY